ncbi:EAL domain-containing protein [Enterocloster citroniae]|uniref:EAL domain-containing protein n=1 Tax=Enterocloster citroniae TaxID=358743 RepID=A0AA41FHL1_9FIRM|nr:GGDEF domain-containing protein [Enterocloster citroniae]MBT9811403.1 EAL domain-containing protein [Enterocloster citroniae]
MIKWSLAAELLALIIIIFLMLHYHDRRLAANYRRNMYRLCLWMSAAAIILNIICVSVISLSDKVPVWVNLLFNSAYFIQVVLLCSVVAAYLSSLILEHVYDKTCMRRYLTSVVLLNLMFWCVVAWNVKSGVLFYFEQGEIYRRGPLNGLGYVIMGIQMVMLLVCYVRNRKSVSRSVVRLIRTMPPIALALILFQHTYPDLLLNGMFAAITDMVMFVSFQSSWNERDSLTAVGNRNSFFQEVTLRMAGRQNFQVVLVTLKQFAVINQKFSYNKGDEFLYEIAKEMDSILPQAKAFRFANVEFAVLLPYASEKTAFKNLAVIRSRFEKPWKLGQISSQIPAFFTDIIYQGQDWSPTQMFEFLEYGVKAAKESIQGIQCIDRVLLEHLARRKQILDIMQQSIEQKRFRVWYQPVYSFEQGNFSSAEALLRLTDYEGNPVPPSEFIPLAEEKGMIDELSWIVLEEVCSFLQRVPSHIRSISINLSMQQFEDRGLTERIKQYLDEYHLTPDRLKIEITERVLLQDMDHMKRMMEQLTGNGIHFYLDDFGTGYSNISCVLSLPFEYIKLDKSLLNGLPGDSRAELLVKSMIQSFERMGLKVIAEGVEEKEQAEMLRMFGADSIQGYYYGKPMPEDEFLAVISHRVKEN